MANLFALHEFRTGAGLPVWWKVECDALTGADWDTLASLARVLVPEFGAVESIPRGGDALALRLAPFASAGPVLIVDDVLTTGGSMIKKRAGRESVIGLVAFARGPCPDWVTPILSVNPTVGGALDAGRKS